MPDVNLPYIDRALQRTEDASRYPFWRHVHWGLYDEPLAADDSPGAYHLATIAMTEHVLRAAGVDDGTRVLDVGCGFGGTLDHIRARHSACRLVGVNLDERQLGRGRDLVGQPAPGCAAVPISFAAADGCRLPVADASVDHVLAIECAFHFPSRKAFLREAARVLRPGGTLALSDFVAAPGSLSALLASRTSSLSQAAEPDPATTGATPGDGHNGAAAEGVRARASSNLRGVGAAESHWYGRFARPLTSAGYARLARSAGLEVLADDDVTARTLPTYAALHRMYQEVEQADGDANPNGALEGLADSDQLAEAARAGHLGYHVLSFRRRGGG